jgi:hypothetical protein
VFNGLARRDRGATGGIRVKRLLLIGVGVSLVLVSPVRADPGPGDEVEVIAGDCADGTTIVRAHNVTETELGFIIRIDGRLVEQGSLAPGERVERTYEVPLGESWFFRIRLGLTGEGSYFSAEDTTDRTTCESPSESPSPTTPPPTTSTPPPTSTPPGTTSAPPTVGGGGGSTTGGPNVGGVSGSRSSAPGGTAFTGPENGVPWLIAAAFALLLLGTFALRLASRSRTTE